MTAHLYGLAVVLRAAAVVFVLAGARIVRKAQDWRAEQRKEVESETFEQCLERLEKER